MKNLLTKFLLCLSVVCSNYCYGQITSSVEGVNQPNLSQDSNKLYFLVKESFPLNANGHIFFDEKWTDGIITDLKNNRFEIPLRYRIAKEEMQVKHNNKTKALQVPQIKQVEFDGRVFIPSNFLINGEKFMSFFEVVNNGKMKLLLQYETKEKKGSHTVHKTFYSKRGKAPAEKISLKKKCILKLMPEKKSEIQQYIKKEKINLKDSNDLEKLFIFYNSL